MQTGRKEVEKLLGSGFGIKKVAGIEKLDNGDWNTIYRIRSDKDWILRISHRRKTQSQLGFELGVVSRLSTTLSFVPAVKPATDGRLFTNYQGKLCTVFQFMSGDEISETPSAVSAAGRTLAVIHEELIHCSRDRRLAGQLSIIDFDWFENYFYTGDAFTEEWLAPESGSELLDEVRGHLPFLRKTRERLSAWLIDRQKGVEVTECIVHGDYYQRNILWDGREITGVIDWDEACTSFLEYEVANAVWEFSLKEKTASMDRTLAEQFLDGYKSIRELPHLSEEALKGFVGVRRLIEIQLDLYEVRQGGSYDLEYCLQNIRSLKNLI